MPKFKVGDRVRPKSYMANDLPVSTKVCSSGGHCLVTNVTHNLFNYMIVNEFGSKLYTVTSKRFEDFELIESVSSTPSQPNIMVQFVHWVKNKARSSEDKALIKAGLLTDCGDLTQDGKDTLLALLLNDKKKELAALAEEKLAEDEKK